MHLLTSQTDPALCTTLSNADIERILGKVNRVWAPAGIQFYLESIVREEPAEASAGETRPPLLARRPAATMGGEHFHVYYLKQFGVNGIFFSEAIFVKDTASLRPVEGGIDEPIPRVTSHELGHALGLPHRQEITNLMASGTTGTLLNSEEISIARATAGRLPFFLPAPDLLAQADTLHEASRRSDASKLYRCLSALPLECGSSERVRQRAAAD